MKMLRSLRTDACQYLITLTLLAGASAGCASAAPDGAPEAVDETSEAIISGRKITDPNHPFARSVVDLATRNTSIDDAGSWIMRCTGTILDSRHVLTAGHCGPNATTAVNFFGGELRAVSEALPFPSAAQGHDIAVLRLATPIPAGYVGVNRISSFPQNNLVFGAGYGNHQPAASGLFWNTAYLVSHPGNEVRLNGGITNPGDSGGPLFTSVGSSFDLVGTLRGDNTYTNIPYYNDWITSVLSFGPRAGAKIIFAHSNKCLDVPSSVATPGVSLQQFGCHGGANQRFETVAAIYGGGISRLRNVSTRLCLDTIGSGVHAAVVQKVCDNASASQVWMTDGTWTGPTRLKNKAAGLCLDVTGASQGDRAGLQLYPCFSGNDGSNQRVRFEM